MIELITSDLVLSILVFMMLFNSIISAVRGVRAANPDLLISAVWAVLLAGIIAIQFVIIPIIWEAIIRSIVAIFLLVISLKNMKILLTNIKELWDHWRR